MGDGHCGAEEFIIGTLHRLGLATIPERGSNGSMEVAMLAALSQCADVSAELPAVGVHGHRRGWAQHLRSRVYRR